LFVSSFSTSDSHLHIFIFNYYSGILTTLVDVMVSVLASSVVDSGFEHRLGQTKDYEIGI